MCHGLNLDSEFMRESSLNLDYIASPWDGMVSAESEYLLYRSTLQVPLRIGQSTTIMGYRTIFYGYLESLGRN